jgi:hypothetical protein
MMEEHQWQSLTVEEVYHLLRDLPVPWWIAGGLAIDLFVGRMTRQHGDIDVLILRRHQLILQEYLGDWDLAKTNQPGLKPWPKGEYLLLGVNQVWCRRTPEAAWSLEIMFMEATEDRWFYRRAPSVGGAITKLGCQTPAGIPYLSPEIQLLYKARSAPSATDEADFQLVLPLLHQEQRVWLKAALEVQFPEGHPWIPQLGTAMVSERFPGDMANAHHGSAEVGFY